MGDFSLLHIDFIIAFKSGGGPPQSKTLRGCTDAHDVWGQNARAPVNYRLQNSLLRGESFARSIPKFQMSERQTHFQFRKAGSEAGYASWLESRKIAATELARRMNLPLGHLVEVWLTGQIRLRGRLRLQEEVLFVEEGQERHLGLMVDQVAFTYREMESCVRVD